MGGQGRTQPSGTMVSPASSETVGWSDCGHESWTPGLILDCFAGTGTTLVAARKLGRRAIGIEASPEFVAGCVERLRRGDDGLKKGYEMRTRMLLRCEECFCDRGGNQAVLLL